MDPASERPAGIAFGRFQVLPDRREVLTDGRPLKLGGRAFDVLVALIEARGAVVGKEALMARVWGRIIEDNSLAAQIAALRAALGAERALIRTVSGRGYQFTGEIRVVPAGPGEPVGVVAAQAASSPPPTNVPEPVSELIGREEELSEILNLVTTHRLVTLTGAGGIGKTTLALALARELRPHFADGVWLAEFSALADPGLVPATVAAAVGLQLGGGEVSAQRVAQAFAGRHLLLVLDTCEHVIDAVAAFAEAVLGASSTLHVVATSREPLRAGGERVYPLQPLAVPVVDVASDDDPLRYGAVRLFIDRVRAAEPRFAPDRRLLGIIAAICRRLDGIPLAIELAAACVVTLGVEGIAGHLDRRFDLLTGGRRTAAPRHQALRATFDWSYELLAEPERVLLRRLAIFAGPFNLEATAAIAAVPEVAPPNVTERLSSLVMKSLVTANIASGTVRYRLLDTTRAYAREKLEESGERERFSRHHAEYYRDLFERAGAEWSARAMAEWLADYGWCIDNLRAALDWAFLPQGDVSIGIALTTATVPLWMGLSLLDECRGRVERALAALTAGADRDTRQEMKLHAALGGSLIYTRGSVAAIGVAWTRVLELAESLGDSEYQLRSLLGLCFFQTANGEHRAAMALAQRFSTLAEKQPEQNNRLVGDRLIGVSQHYLGDQSSARRHLEHMLAHYDPAAERSHIISFPLDERVMARTILARVMWLQGFPDQAMSAAETSIADARAANHLNSLCYALSQGACPIALFVGDLVAAESYVEMLLSETTKRASALWHVWGHCYRGTLIIRRGDVVTGLQLLREGYAELAEARFAGERLIAFQMAEAAGRAGQIDEGLVVIGQAIDQFRRAEEHWQIAELLRVRGELLILQDADGAVPAAEEHFQQALAWARRQGALAWELRAATSLARLWSNQSRHHEALALLQPVYDRFTEGFDTADLKAAKALLDEFAEPNA